MFVVVCVRLSRSLLDKSIEDILGGQKSAQEQLFAVRCESIFVDYIDGPESQLCSVCIYISS